MYYFLPKAAGRPVYSYRLSVVHFWSLVFLYIWAGPHHLLYTALPDWAQTLGMVFSLMLWAPSWGGMLNGLLTLRGAWDKLRTDPVIKFFVVAVTFYGMSTFEGPLLSIKSVSALGHYTDWIIGHVHGGALGWNAFMTFGMIYWLVPRLWKTEIKSKALAEVHFWLATVGILLYVASMWISGISQGLFWGALDADGMLKYPDFVEGVLASRLMYQTRLVGGLLFLAGFVVMIYNLVVSIRGAEKRTHSVDVVPLAPTGVSSARLFFGMPVVLTTTVVILAVIMGVTGKIGTPIVIALMIAVTLGIALSIRGGKGARWHRLTEGNSLVFTVLVLLAILVGGIVELVPTIVIANNVPLTAAASAYLQEPYSSLEVEGRDLYVREGCYTCHSQMIRPFRHETLRYGEYSRMEEFIYDHPFQWGSKRTGPDLHRVGGKYPSLWHYLHMSDPRATSPGSNMPGYEWLKTGTVDLDGTGHKMHTLRALGVPYSDADIAQAKATALSQGRLIVGDLEKGGVALAPDSEMTALIAYLQRLGRGPQPTGVDGAPVSQSAEPAPAAREDS
jgi:cytochrome c oxidase cbb3-type subunit I/II